MGRFEELALEQGLVLKEACLKSGEEPSILDVITVGPDSDMANDMIRRAYGMGADKGTHVRTRIRNGTNGLVPAFATASLLAGGAKSGYDLILTGIMSQDLMAGQTGPMLAELLSIPCATGVVRIDPLEDKSILRVEQEMDGGIREIIDLSLPALLAIQAGGEARYPTLSNMLKAGEKPITIFDEAEICPIPRLETFDAVENPGKTREGIKVKGTLKEQVHQFNKFLREKNLL